MRDPSGQIETSGTLVELERDLAKWRRTHHAPTPLPEDFWNRAADLVAQLGVSAVARRLRLNAAHLKRRASHRVAVEPAAATFIELLPPMSTFVAECALEVESPRGARMRITIKHVPPACLTNLLREFVG